MAPVEATTRAAKAEALNSWSADSTSAARKSGACAGGTFQAAASSWWTGSADNGRAVTAAVDRMTFIAPVHVSELMTFRATVNAAWNTSMEVGVRVEAEDPRSGEARHTSTAYLTMVALDDAGEQTKVPPLAAESATEKRREREAELRRTNRLTERDEILSQRD